MITVAMIPIPAKMLINQRQILSHVLSLESVRFSGMTGYSFCSVMCVYSSMSGLHECTDNVQVCGEPRCVLVSTAAETLGDGTRVEVRHTA